jgi:hypothetical protein
MAGAGRTGDGAAPGGADRLEQAVAELYASDPREFVARRATLADAARHDGDLPAAARIGGLRKPTVSAWTVNALALTRPELLAELLGLGDQLRQAEADLDGEQLRELSRQRRILLDSLSRAAFAGTGLHPSASVRDEVTATLAAALADPALGEQVRSGTLLRAVRWNGFGAGSGADLALVPPVVGSTRAGQVERGTQRAAQRPGQRAAERAKAQAEREQQRRREQAAAEVVQAEQAVSAALEVEREWIEQCNALREQVAAAQRELDGAHLDVRHARAQLEKAARRRDRLAE